MAGKLARRHPDPTRCAKRLRKFLADKPKPATVVWLAARCSACRQCRPR